MRNEDPKRENAGEKKDIDRIVEAILYLYTESRRATKEVARHHGLTGPQVTALKMLEGFGAISLSDLSTRMSARNSTITGIADRMERDGLVQRVRSDEDRRVVLIRLTPKGLTLAQRIPITSMEIFASALRSLPEHERDNLQRILHLLNNRVRDEVSKTEASLGETSRSKASRDRKTMGDSGESPRKKD